MQLWPHSFTATIRITLTDHALQVDGVRNEGVQTMSFQAALHTYFRVAEGQFATILGLANSPSYDKLTQANAAASGMDQLIVKNAIDSIYAQTPDHLILQTGLGELQIDKHGFPIRSYGLPGMRARGKLLILQMMKGVRSSAWRQLA
jgi:glucose-6-phosphate 1-epimerase